MKIKITQLTHSFCLLSRLYLIVVEINHEFNKGRRRRKKEIRHEKPKPYVDVSQLSAAVAAPAAAPAAATAATSGKALTTMS